MIQFIVTAIFIVVGVFLLSLIICLMTWVITKFLRLLFPHKFQAKPKVEKKSGKPAQHITGQAVEDRCDKCAEYGICPMPFLVPAPCRKYHEKSETVE